MSKAFTRESDDAPEQPIVAMRPSPLPFGVKNYITASGAERLQTELNHLIETERPRLANDSTNPDAQRQLLSLDQKIAMLGASLESAVVIEPPTEPDELVRFGATVTVRDQTGEEATYRLVGIDETDLDRNWISWRSPLARALLNSKPGDHVRFRAPAGEQVLEIVRVAYER